MKKKTCFLFAVLSCLTLAGCGNKIPEMNSQEQAMITEYAAGLLLKYSPAYEDKMSDMNSGQLSEENEVKTEDNKEEVNEITLDEDTVKDGEKVSEETVDAPSVSVNEGVETSQVSLSDFLSAGNFSVEYAGFEVCDSYSGAQEGELAFEMTASPNTKLLVMKFNVVNLEGTEQNFNLLDKNVKATVTVSGKSKRALLTMLEDDLLTANIPMQASETKTFVIVTEYKSDILDAIESVQICFNSGESQAEYVY